MEWIINNKEWIFGGIGVAVISAIISLVVALFKRKPKKTFDMIQKSGHNSTNIQIGGDCNVEK